MEVSAVLTPRYLGLTGFIITVGSKAFRFSHLYRFGSNGPISCSSVSGSHFARPPAAGAVADIALHRANVLGKQPAGINSILFPSDALLNHHIPRWWSYPNILSGRYDHGNNSSNWLFGWPLTILVMMSVKLAIGSTS